MKTRSRLLPLSALAWALSLVGPTNAQTVTTSADVVDVSGSATVADLPGPDGVVSLREALLASDNTPGRQTIDFAIPPSDWPGHPAQPGQVLVLANSSFSAVDSVVIDGASQTTFSGDTYPDGNEVTLQRGLRLRGDDSEAYGLHWTDLTLEGDQSVLRDNTGGADLTVLLAAGCALRNNEADTIEISYSSGNTIAGNVAERVRIWGFSSDLATGNVIGGPDAADRNYLTGWGNVGEHGSVAGTTVELYNTDQTLIQNNWIGTTPDGMDIGNRASTVGIGVYSGNRRLEIRDNLIAISARLFGGTTGPAKGTPILLELYDGAQEVEIYGNSLGLNARGKPVLGGEVGIWVSRHVFEFPSDVRIGGTNPGEGNTIAGHEGAGILMWNGPGVPAVGRVRVSGNSIHDNLGTGIDLMPNTWDFGPTPNDPMDADDGANGLQNTPVLLAAQCVAGGLQVAGTLASEPSRAYTIEVFATPTCDPSGFGQGEVFLGSTPVTTDAQGSAAFLVGLPPVPAGWVVSATATSEPGGATSEFSACRTVQGHARWDPSPKASTPGPSPR